MEFSKPEKFTARVSDKYFLTDNERFLYLKFELVLPDRISFQAGQYVSLKIHEQGERRSYSIVSTPDDNHGFHLLTEIVGEGKGSQFLKNIELGQEVEVLAPMGRFVISEKGQGVNDKLLFVATGSGIVPIYSMINDLLINKHEQRQIRLQWGMRSEQDLFFVDNFERLAEEYSNFVFDIVLSQPSQKWDLCTGHVQDCLDRDFGATTLKGWEGYVCGRQETVINIVEKLEELGMVKDNIYHEKYT
ncbi:MAG: FAD-binding oxidoreductase [bacterium]